MGSFWPESLSSQDCCTSKSYTLDSPKLRDACFAPGEKKMSCSEFSKVPRHFVRSSTMAPFFTIILYIFVLTGPISVASLADSRSHGLPQVVDHDAELIVDRIPPQHPPAYIMQKRNVFLSYISPAKVSSRSATATRIIAQTKYKRQSDPSSPSSLPRPFDSNLGNNFTESSCPLFFSGFLNDEQFQNCHPASMLLTVIKQNSEPHR